MEQWHPQSPAHAYPDVERRVHVCPVLVAREVEDPAEAGTQDAVGHALRQQPRCAARGGGQRCGTPPVRHPVPHSGPLAGSGGQARAGPGTSWRRWRAWLSAAPPCPGDRWAPPAAAPAGHSAMDGTGQRPLASERLQGLAYSLQDGCPVPDGSRCPAPGQRVLPAGQGVPSPRCSAPPPAGRNTPRPTCAGPRRRLGRRRRRRPETSASAPLAELRRGETSERVRGAQQGLPAGGQQPRHKSERYLGSAAAASAEEAQGVLFLLMRHGRGRRAHA